MLANQLRLVGEPKALRDLVSKTVWAASLRKDTWGWPQSVTGTCIHVHLHTQPLPLWVLWQFCQFIGLRGFWSLHTLQWTVCAHGHLSTSHSGLCAHGQLYTPHRRLCARGQLSTPHSSLCVLVVSCPHLTVDCVLVVCYPHLTLDCVCSWSVVHTSQWTVCALGQLSTPHSGLCVCAHGQLSTPHRQYLNRYKNGVYGFTFYKVMFLKTIF